MNEPTSKKELKDLILRSLALDYVSRSCQDDIETGNHYQSISLDGNRTSGFRTSRTDLLDEVDFADRKVLDLGSNLGELSRTARSHGAALVDGYEYDPFFIELANLVNAFNGTTRVSFFRRDITKPTSYVEHYDIVLCFAVFIYVKGLLHELAAVTDQVLILETHRLDGNLETTYIAALREHLPAYKILGQTEWGTPHSGDVKRAVIAFARNRAALDNALRTPSEHR